MKDKRRITIGIADDHTLFRQGLKKILELNKKFDILFDVSDGSEVIEALKYAEAPDILLVDLNMTKLGGAQVLQWFDQHDIEMKVIIISMYTDEDIIIDMIEQGARAFLNKSVSTEILWDAIETVSEKGWCLTEPLTGQLMRRRHARIKTGRELTGTDKKILYYLCKELTHAEIAEKMFLSVRTIDDYSNKLIKKLKVRSKAGLIIYAIKNNLDSQTVP